MVYKYVGRANRKSRSVMWAKNVVRIAYQPERDSAEIKDPIQPWIKIEIDPNIKVLKNH